MSGEEEEEEEEEEEALDSFTPLKLDAFHVLRGLFHSGKRPAPIERS